MADVRKDDHVRIDGWLVEADAPDGWRWRSSTTREDTGGRGLRGWSTSARSRIFDRTHDRAGRYWRQIPKHPIIQHMKTMPCVLLALLWANSASASASAATAPADSGEANLVFVGDIMVAEIPGELIARGVDPFQPFESFLDAQDLRIGNLECVVATTGKAEAKPFTFRADPQVIPVLARHFDGLSLANNHSGDFGKEAFAEQLGLLRAAGLAYFGGGDNAAEAHKPWIVERNGLRIALLGYVEFKPRSFEASATRPGVAWSGEDDQVINDIIAARRTYHADLVIPFMHWGWEDEPQPSERLREFSKRMLDAGADMVVGSHPHVTQGVEYYKGKLIVYSLGNFLFNSFDTPATTTGWVLKVRMNKAGMVDWQTRVARLDGDGVPHPDLKASSPCGKVGRGHHFAMHGGMNEDPDDDWPDAGMRQRAKPQPRAAM